MASKPTIKSKPHNVPNINPSTRFRTKPVHFFAHCRSTKRAENLNKLLASRYPREHAWELVCSRRTLAAHTVNFRPEQSTRVIYWLPAAEVFRAACCLCVPTTWPVQLKTKPKLQGHPCRIIRKRDLLHPLIIQSTVLRQLLRHPLTIQSVV